MSTDEARREPFGLMSPAALRMCERVLTEYEPPAWKDMLAIFQCSIRRPYSRSPSHGSMRKAIRLATGSDPWREFEQCRCHVVVLSSYIGPVPYELENVHPANVRGGGVRHMADEQYAAARPILARRMAAYLEQHHHRYRLMTTFTYGRYAEVIRDAQELAGLDFPVLPEPDGLRVRDARQYWVKYWPQLFFELLEGMTKDECATAIARLEREGLQFESP